MVRPNILVLVLILEEGILSFTRAILAVHFFLDAFLNQVEEVLFYGYWLSIFYHERVLDFLSAFPDPIVMYRCESWTIKKAEHQRIDALELWCWRRLLRVPWTARRSNQSILKEISPEYSLEGLMLS